MFTRMILATAALAVATATAPLSTASAAPDIDFNVTIQTDHGSISFGSDPLYDPMPSSMSCWEARNYLKGEFKKVQKVECNGAVYTFHVKKFKFGQWKTVKINKHNGQYWFA